MHRLQAAMMHPSASSSSSISTANAPPQGSSSSNTSSSSLIAARANGARPPKRRKTQRACTHCRDHKLRCDFENAVKNEEDGSLICKHCWDFGIQCIVPAPAAASSSSAAGSSSSAIANNNNNRSIRNNAHTNARRSAGTAAFASDDLTASNTLLDSASVAAALSSASAASSWQTDDRALDDPRYSGESSLSALVSHFVFIITGREQQVNELQSSLTTDGARPSGTDDFLLLPQTRYPAPMDGSEARLINATIDRPTVDMLIDRYLTHIQSLNAVVSRQEVLDSIDAKASEIPVSSLSAIGLAVLCLSAMYRSTPRYARDALLFHQRHRRMSVFRSSVETVQSLLVVTLSIEMMAPDTNDAAGMCLNMLGLAIRMAHDLGMHRNMQKLGVSPTRSRRLARIWSALVMSDRWYALCYGQPTLIQMEDCDALPPSVFDDDQDPALADASTPRPFLTHVFHYEMSLLVGRIHKVAFGPLGLKPSSHGKVNDIIADIEQWHACLPMRLNYPSMKAFQYDEGASRHPSSMLEGAWLFCMGVTIDFLMYRITLNLAPGTAPFDLRQRWTDLVRRSSEALEWLNSPEGIRCLDSYSITMYFLVQCSIVQYYAACQGGSLHSLRVARQSLQNRGSVATAATSRSQVYDPYGPNNQPDQQQQHHFQRMQAGVSDVSFQNKAPSNTSHSTVQTHEGVSGRSSPSPESGVGAGSASGSGGGGEGGEGQPPKLLRLRLKISALLSMLLEIAERRRAAVLSAQDDEEEAQANSKRRATLKVQENVLKPLKPTPVPQSHLRFGSGPQYSLPSHPFASSASPSQVQSQSSYLPSSHQRSQEQQKQQEQPPPTHHALASSSAAAARDRIASSSPMSTQSANSQRASYVGDSASSVATNANVYASPHFAYPSRQMSDGSMHASASPHAQSLATNTPSSTQQYSQQHPHQRTSSTPSSSLDPTQHPTLAHPFSQTTGFYGGAAGTPAGLAYQAQAHSQQQPPQTAVLYNDGAIADAANASAMQTFNILSPRNIEDLDLVTIQRWADAVLLKPSVGPDQHQHANMPRHNAM